MHDWHCSVGELICMMLCAIVDFFSSLRNLGELHIMLAGNVGAPVFYSFSPQPV